VSDGILCDCPEPYHSGEDDWCQVGTADMMGDEWARLGSADVCAPCLRHCSRWRPFAPRTDNEPPPPLDELLRVTFTPAIEHLLADPVFKKMAAAPVNR